MHRLPTALQTYYFTPPEHQLMKLSFAVFVFLTSLNIYAKTEITGKIIDKVTKEPLPFAEIILRPIPSGEIIGTVTAENGSFSISAEPGNYELQVTYVGQQLYTNNLSITQKAIHLGTLLVDNSNMLSEVVINARKKLIEQKIDRLVFNVANSSKAAQGDVIEVLKITPGVRVESNKISMIGKGNLQVMIDDKIIQLSGPDLINFLRSLASENIQSIEVINNPPAKYEAEGNSGLINIILKKAKKDSWNAQLKGTFFERSKPNYRTSAIFKFNKNKLSLASRVGYIRQMAIFKEEISTDYPTEQWRTSTPVYIDVEGFVASLDLSYKITKNWEMGGQYYFNQSLARIGVNPSTRVFDKETNQATRSLQSNGYEPQHPRRHIVNFNNTINLDSLGKKITIDLDYFKDFNRDRKNYEGELVTREPYSKQYYSSINNNERLVENYSAKLDIEYPLSWLDMDFGGKISRSNVSNDVSFFNSALSIEPVNQSPMQMNDFTYREDIHALYFSGNRNFGEKWSAQLGLRMENTRINTGSIYSELSRKDNYTNLFPTFYLSYEATEKSNFSLNYSRRIQRPPYFFLNPTVYFRNPFQQMEGNPYLQPAFIQNIEFSNIYRNFVTKFYYTYEDNLFDEVPIPSPDTNITNFTVENYINRNRFGFSENYTFDGIDWWSSNNNLNINYSEADLYLEEQVQHQNGFNASLSTYNDFNLNSEKTIIAGFNYWYQFAGIDGIFKTDPVSSLGLSLQFLLLQKNLSFTLKGNDLFKTAIERKTAYINGVHQELRRFNDTRQFWFTVTYKFGNKDISTRQHETGNEEEKSRI